MVVAGVALASAITAGGQKMERHRRQSAVAAQMILEGGGDPSSSTTTAGAARRRSNDDDDADDFDYYRDPSRYTDRHVILAYLRLAGGCLKLTTHYKFDAFVIVVICVAGVLVGVQTYAGMNENPAVVAIDMIILTVFLVECLLKICAEAMAPWRYWTGKEWKWNNFDFIIVVMCMPFWGDTFGGGSVALLRLMRLLRVAKLIKKIPQLQMIVMGLVGGLGSIGYILLLLFLIFYLYAIVGIFAFRDNDPWHYGSLPTALITLFRCSTLEDWTDVMYINIYGCDVYLNVYVDSADETPDRAEYWCEVARDKPVVSMLYFVTFTVVSALVMLSLFVGAVTMSMSESMQTMTRESDEKQKREKVQKQLKKLRFAKELETRREMIEAEEQALRQEARARNDAGQGAFIGSLVNAADSAKYGDDDGSTATASAYPEKAPPPPAENNDQGAQGQLTRAASISHFLSKTLLGHDPEKEAEALTRTKKQMEGLMMAAWENVDLMSVLQLHAVVDPRSCAGELETMPNGPKKAFMQLSNCCRILVNDTRFLNSITLVIVLAGILVGVQTDEKIEAAAAAELSAIDSIILAIFTFEVIVKFIAEGFYPLRFFRSAWNTFDLVIVVGSFSMGGSMITMLRLLRLLRVLKLVKSLPDLQVIVSALIMGLGSIGYIGVILLLVFYLFAIVGMMLFAQNDPWHFGTLHRAMLTLFRCSTLEDWSDVMYINMYGCDSYGYEAFPEECADPHAHYVLSMIYFVVFIVVGALVLLTLFIGVVTTSMDEASSNQAAAAQIESRCTQIRQNHDISEVEIDAYCRVFNILDLDGGGTIDDDELRAGLESVGKNVSDEELQYMMHQVDADDSGEIDLPEFLMFMINVKARDAADEQQGRSGSEGSERTNRSENRTTRFVADTARQTSPTDFLSYLGDRQNQAIVEMAHMNTLLKGYSEGFGLPKFAQPKSEEWLKRLDETSRDANIAMRTNFGVRPPSSPHKKFASPPRNTSGGDSPEGLLSAAEDFHRTFSAPPLVSPGGSQQRQNILEPLGDRRMDRLPVDESFAPQQQGARRGGCSPHAQQRKVVPSG